MTAIILLRPNSNSIILCADRQESGKVIDYNTFSSVNEKDFIDFDGVKYCRVDLFEKNIPINQTNKIFKIADKYLFAGSGDSNGLKIIKNLVEENISKKQLIEYIRNYLKDFRKSADYSLVDMDPTNLQFLLIDLKNLKIHFFNKETYEIFKKEVLIIGDIETTPIIDMEDKLVLSLKNENINTVFNNMAFALHSLSIRKSTIASPFASGCNLWHISKKGTRELKLINYIRWEKI